MSLILPVAVYGCEAWSVCYWNTRTGIGIWRMGCWGRYWV